MWSQPNNCSVFIMNAVETHSAVALYAAAHHLFFLKNLINVKPKKRNPQS